MTAPTWTGRILPSPDGDPVGHRMPEPVDYPRQSAPAALTTAHPVADTAGPTPLPGQQNHLAPLLGVGGVA